MNSKLVTRTIIFPYHLTITLIKILFIHLHPIHPNPSSLKLSLSVLTPSLTNSTTHPLTLLGFSQCWDPVRCFTLQGYQG